MAPDIQAHAAALATGRPPCISGPRDKAVASPEDGSREAVCGAGMLLADPKEDAPDPSSPAGTVQYGLAGMKCMPGVRPRMLEGHAHGEPDQPVFVEGPHDRASRDGIGAGGIRSSYPVPR
jgi:hypothetical protein